MKRKGFTLVEVIVVLAILAILLLLLVPGAFAIFAKSKEKSCTSLIGNIESAAKVYVTNNKYDLNFVCGGTKDITLQTLIDSGDLTLEDDEFVNPLTDEEIALSNTVSVTYDCDTKSFLYVVNGISCSGEGNGCDLDAIMPTVSDKVYNGTEQTGVTGGSNVTVVGTKKAKDVGTYTVTAVPSNGACWSDDTKSPKTETWDITENRPVITLADYTTSYTGENILNENAVVKNSSGNVISGIPVIYTYYTGEECSGTVISGGPINVGAYSVKAHVNNYGAYNASSGNCAKLTINKADPILTTSHSNLTTTYPNITSFTYTYSGDGAVSCSSSNTSIATCSIDRTNKKITVTPVIAGSVNITVSASETANYNAVSKNVSITIKGMTNTISVYPIDGLIYNKNAQTLATVSDAEGTVYFSTSTELTSSNYTSGSTTISTGTNAGSYTVYYYTPGNDYYGEASGNVTTSIGKASCTCTISSVPSLNYPVSKSGTISYNCTGDGSATVTSSSTSAIKSSSVGNAAATLTAQKVGSATITVGQSSGTNYNACTTDSESVSAIASTYTISYDANGGSGAPSAQTKTYAVALTLSSTKPTRTGYNFLGWSTNSAATSASYSAGGSYTNNESATLYAVWLKTYTITYNANGGSGAPSAQTKTKGTNLTLSSTKPTYTGYNFSSWNTKADGSGTSYSSGGTYSTDADVTLYAQWTVKTYTISYSANGGSGAPSSQTKTHGVNLTLRSGKPTRSGYTFIEWNTNSYGTGTSYDPGDTYTSNSGTTLYAIWQASDFGNAYGYEKYEATHTMYVWRYGSKCQTRNQSAYNCDGTKCSGCSENYCETVGTITTGADVYYVGVNWNLTSSTYLSLIVYVKESEFNWKGPGLKGTSSVMGWTCDTDYITYGGSKYHRGIIPNKCTSYSGCDPYSCHTTIPVDGYC